MPAHKTKAFAALLEMLRWFAGQQIRNVAVSWTMVFILVAHYNMMPVIITFDNVRLWEVTYATPVPSLTLIQSSWLLEPRYTWHPKVCSYFFLFAPIIIAV